MECLIYLDYKLQLLHDACSVLTHKPQCAVTFLLRASVTGSTLTCMQRLAQLVLGVGQKAGKHIQVSIKIP